MELMHSSNLENRVKNHGKILKDASTNTNDNTELKTSLEKTQEAVSTSESKVNLDVEVINIKMDRMNQNIAVLYNNASKDRVESMDTNTNDNDN